MGIHVVDLVGAETGPLQRCLHGALRAIAVLGRNRSQQLPDVPTVAEQGIKGYDVSQWMGIFAPAKTPAAIVDQLHRETIRALQAPDLRDMLKNQGAEPVGNTGDQFNVIIKDEIEKWRKLVQALGLKAD